MLLTNALRRIRNAWHLWFAGKFSDLVGMRKHRIALLTT
ncbi:DUF3265 domain-containing protein [Vibrio vulnificus]|nr:DUF3265 domain-containing protein [Vibrio vulnificus]EGQ9283966.1 DUF3265 domain-containing protein [Vibrio vulnificus]EGQ9971609.1 DUF3265 domain-containing protein [Vibrio vulnificus]EIJ0943886.1 DUF3265 domain-containing protein [Vibrio vulnificus]